MLKNNEWYLQIAGDSDIDGDSDYYELNAELFRSDEMIALITGRGGTRKIIWYKTDSDIEIPFDWFMEAMKMADDRVTVA